MDVARLPQKKRFLIAVKDAIVREDLRELLEEAAPLCEVVSLLPRETAWEGAFAAAIFDRSEAELLGDARIVELRNRGTALILLDGPFLATGSDAGGFEVLSQPFRSDDVLSLLRRIGALL